MLKLIKPRELVDMEVIDFNSATDVVWSKGQNI